MGNKPNDDGGKKAAYELTVKGDDKDYKCKLCKPKMAVIETAMAFIIPTRGEPQYFQAGKIIINSCWVSGDEEIREDDQLFMSACMQAYELVEMKDTSLKKI